MSATLIFSSHFIAPESSITLSGKVVRWCGRNWSMLTGIASSLAAFFYPRPNISFFASYPMFCTYLEDGRCTTLLSSTQQYIAHPLIQLAATAPPAVSLYCGFIYTCSVIACGALLCWLLLSRHMVLAVHPFSCGSVVWSLVAGFVSGRPCLCTDSTPSVLI